MHSLSFNSSLESPLKTAMILSILLEVEHKSSSRSEISSFFVLFRFYLFGLIIVILLGSVVTILNISNKFVFVFFDLLHNFFTSLVHAVMRSSMATGIALGFKVFTFHESFQLWILASSAENVFSNKLI